MNEFYCPTCTASLDERQLLSSSVTTDRCPKCSSVIRQSNKSIGTDLVAVIAGDIAAIDEWIDGYAADTTQLVRKRPIENGTEWRWAIGTPHAFACECYYDQKRTGFAQIRMVTKDHSEIVWKRQNDLAEMAAKCGLQPFGSRQSMVLDGATEAVWGIVQYVNVNTLSTSLLKAAAKRLDEAMRFAVAGLLGDAAP